MKRLLLLVLITLVGLPYLFSQSDNATVLRKSIDKNKTLHSFDVWQLDKIRGDEKAVLMLNAIEYSVLNTPNKTYAVQFDLNLESGSINDPINHFTKRLYRYIEEEEYAEVMVATKEIINNYKVRKENDQYGAIQYITSDGIKMGFEYINDKDIAFIEYLLNGVTFRGEFQYPDKVFELIHEQLDIANRKLYLPENEEKLKKAKKSKQETKDVIIDDI